MYCFAKQPDDTFWKGNRKIVQTFKNGVPNTTVSGDRTPLATLYFTSDPYLYDPDNAANYIEWYPGITQFPCLKVREFSIPAGVVTIPKANITNIGTFEGDLIACPEDCTGLFSNMSLGYAPESYVGSHHNKRWEREDEYSSWVLIRDDTRDHETYYDITIDFSRFDFSNTRIMTSLFENCFGTADSISFTNSRDPVYVMVVPPGKYLMKEYVYDRYTFKARTVMFSGLAGWNTGEATDISRMFANIKWNKHSTKSYDGPFNIDGINNFDYPKVTNASYLFANSDINLKDVIFNFDSTGSLNLSYAFNNYSFSAGSDMFLDLAKWRIAATSGNLTSTFRNIKTIERLYLGSTFNNMIAGIEDSSLINYMFASDSGISSLSHISVKNGSDWKDLNSTLTGYKMFLNCSKLPNFITGETNIDYANNTRSTGYFDPAPPEKIKNAYIRKNTGWLASDVYIQDSEGVWKLSEVYF